MREEEMGVNAQFLVEMEKEKCGSVWKEVKQASIDTFKVHTYVESVNDDDEKIYKIRFTAMFWQICKQKYKSNIEKMNRISSQDIFIYIFHGT